MRRPFTPVVLCSLVAVCSFLWLGGCSPFGLGTEALRFRTLVRTDTLVTGTDRQRPSGFVVLQSEADEAAFAAEYDLAAPLPEVDYETSSVVGVVYHASAPGGVVLVSSVALDGDRVSMCTTYDGPPLVIADEPAAAFPAHLVVTARIDRHVTRMGAEPTSLGC